MEAASTFRDFDVSLLIIAIGDDKTGARIPVTDEHGNKRYLMYQGKEIWSVMNTEILSGIADNVPGSALVKVNEGTLDFASIYKRFHKATARKSTSVYSVSRQEMFQFFLLPAFVLLILYLYSDFLYRRKQ